MSLGIAVAERGWLPDGVVRVGIRRLLQRRLQERRTAAGASRGEDLSRHLEAMRTGPVALVPDTANSQHYELPAAFFQRVLGPRLKYSCCWWPDGTTSLAAAEEAMLRLTCDRAGIVDGMRVLDLGCGWGSWALWVAERYPHTDVVAVSNSDEQRRYIEQETARRGVHNVDVVTADMNRFEPSGTFDRVVSVEMFEHMRNYEQLLARIASWLRPEGRLFVHVFCHRRYNYFFEDGERDDWMARHFFTGGMMPAHDLLFNFAHAMEVVTQWRLDGGAYQRTAQAWLDNLDADRGEVERVLAGPRGRSHGRRAAERWRLFFLACAELFGYGDGQEWFVSHYVLRPTRSSVPVANRT